MFETIHVEHLNVENRAQYLKYSLIVENLVSVFLSKLIGIKDEQESKNFGNKSTALSFMNKINLLLDLEIVERKDYWKFQKFMEIRNQFMHNILAANYVDCFEFVGDKGKILSEYPQEATASLEGQLKNASLRLAHEVVRLTTSAIDMMLTKIATKTNIESYAKLGLAFLNTLGAIDNEFPNSSELDEKPLKLFLEKLPEQLSSTEMDNEAFSHLYTFQDLLESIAKKQKPNPQKL